MDAETLIALQGSIKKWGAIVANNEGDTGAQACPLCAKFNSVCNPLLPRGCHGCPVREATGRSGCRGTPYEDYEDAEYDEDGERMHNIAVAEVNFLKSLLPASGDLAKHPNAES